MARRLAFVAAGVTRPGSDDGAPHLARTSRLASAQLGRTGRSRRSSRSAHPRVAALGVGTEPALLPVRWQGRRDTLIVPPLWRSASAQHRDHLQAGGRSRKRPLVR
ncbi:MAG: hypothetical protein ACREOH_22950, partial [Candidatus Entotheonellia bacterium]